MAGKSAKKAAKLGETIKGGARKFVGFFDKLLGKKGKK